MTVRKRIYLYLLFSFAFIIVYDETKEINLLFLNKSFALTSAILLFEFFYVMKKRIQFQFLSLFIAFLLGFHLFSSLYLFSENEFFYKSLFHSNKWGIISGIFLLGFLGLSWVSRYSDDSSLSFHFFYRAKMVTFILIILHVLLIGARFTPTLSLPLSSIFFLLYAFSFFLLNIFSNRSIMMK